ncbi:MAG: hypothetical protein C4522_07385 [Desulfobacteraceae bacterium]|nr:MAG: hypothetical protein C4522_07385 [Desulfobacteraceae bacterium]
MMFDKIRTLIYDASIYGASSVLGQVINFCLLPVFTIYLTPKDFGILSMTSIVISLFVPIANLGMSNAIFRRFNLCKDEKEKWAVFDTGLLSVLIGAGIFCVLCLFFIDPITNLFVKELSYSEIFVITVLTAALTTIAQVPAVVLRALRRVKLIALINIVSVLLTSGISIWLVVWKQYGVYGIVISNLAANSILVTVYCFIFFRRHQKLQIDFTIWKYMFRYGVPIIPHRLQSIGLSQFSHYMIASMVSMDQAGIYGIAIRITMPMTFIVGAIQNAWVPYKFQLHANETKPETIFSSITTYYLICISYVWALICLWGPEIVRMMTTANYHEATYLIPVVALIPLSQSIYFMLGTGVEITDNTKPIPLISLGGLIVTVISAFLLIRQTGSQGAAISTCFGWITMAVIVFLLSQKRYKITFDWWCIGLNFFLVMVLLIVVIEMQTMGTIVRIALNFLISLLFPVFQIIILLRSRNERARILRLFKTRKLSFL